MFSRRIVNKKHAGKGKVGLCLTVGTHQPLPACSFVSGRYARAQTHALAIYAADKPGGAIRALRIYFLAYQPSQNCL